MKRSVVLAAAAALTLAVAGCASANKNSTASASAGGSSSMSDMSNASSTGSGSAGGVSGSNSSMAMNMSSGTTTVVNAKGVPVPVPVKTIATGYWKDMKIQAETMTPVPFYIYNGSSTFREVKPTSKTSFHLMVMLSDRHTGEPIAYATVWAVITKNGKTVFNEQQWQMDSEYMGPHYGNNVALPGKGTYKLKLLISAPVAALHVEYDKMWVGTHTLTSTFTWSGIKQQS